MGKAYHRDHVLGQWHEVPRLRAVHQAVPGEHSQMSYQTERDQFVARMAAEGLPLHVTTTLLRAATTLQRYAELACSSEAADRDRVDCPGILAKHADHCICEDWPVGTHAAGRHSLVPRIEVLGQRVERRIVAMLGEVNGGTQLQGLGNWIMDTQGDPRGYVLRVIPPSYAERNAGRDRFNREAIGVPSGPTRFRF
jgi:hypothetical protein